MKNIFRSGKIKWTLIFSLCVFNLLAQTTDQRAENIQNGTFNIVAPLHPTRKEVYEDSCARFGWEAPTFSEPAQRPDYKVISNKKLLSYYEYDFKYPDPLTFHYTRE